LTALMVASKYGDIDLVRALIQSGADVNARDNNGLTALIHASKYGDVARVLTLIEAGAHVDSRDNCEWTALLHASKYGDVDRVQALVEAGADVSARNNEDRCALSIAREREHSEIVAYLESVEFQSQFGSFGFSEHEDMEIARSSVDLQDDENMFDSAADARYQTHSNYPDVDSSHITLGRKLGQGSYAIVHEGTWHGVNIAVKRIRLPHGESWCSESQDLLRQVFEDQVRPEVDIMSAIKHPFVVGCYGCCVDPPSILLELCPRGSLSQMLQTCREDEGLCLLMSWHQRLCMLRQVASAMKYLHSKNVFHRDLRAMNVLVAQDMTTKVSDVGLGKFVDEVSTRSAGTLGEGANPRWLAPELVSDDRPFTRACDVYGFGTIVWEMMEWRLPWEGMSSLQIIRAMVQGRGLEVAGQDRWHSLPGPAPQHPDTFSGISSLATQCLNPDPSIRPSFEDIVQILLQFEEQEPRQELCNVGSPRGVQSAQNNGSLDALNRLPTCCVCLDPNANTIMSGCGHLCLCQDCSDSAQVSTCPICRAPGTPQRIYLV
jgi:serine/threonine protein kinase